MANLGLGVVALSTIVMAFVLADRPVDKRTAASAGDSFDGAVQPARIVNAEAPVPPVRPIYRHSVVPGGVRSQEEIAYAMERDPVVASHYAKIIPASMRNERLQKPMLAHVSYRLGEKIYWTKKPVPPPANEPVMTDGQQMIRERCGNLISMEPLAPTTEEEPPVPSFDLLMDPIQFQWMRLAYTPPPRPTPKPNATATALPPVVFRPFAPAPPVGRPGGTPTTQSIPTPGGRPEVLEAPVPVPVPEPSTLMMFGLAGAAGAAHWLRRRARARKSQPASDN